MKTLADGGARDINKITLIEKLIKDKALIRFKTINGLKTKLLA